MGIPAFYRWLTKRYPLTVVDAIEEESTASVNGCKVPIDSSKPNPNGYEFDNLYLDMNGIVHPCFHPEKMRQPETYEEVFHAVFKYIDRVFSIVRPRKLLFMAIDGVAPRAKMNQQRSRRFRAAKDAADQALEASLGQLPAEEKVTPPLDSNIITPGTEFMALLSSALKYYVHLRMNDDPGWRGIKVILSDANVPGEGEHKIMSYIRLQRNLPGFDPNIRHCIYGLDADLIMLGLATHEVNFSILREDVQKFKDDIRMKKRKFKANADYISYQTFLFLNIWVLREYLVHDLRLPDVKLETDLERLIDDFVFMCVFVGNDFLPNVPSLDIYEEAIDLLMYVYRMEFDRMGGYLTSSFEVNLDRVEHFIKVVGSKEDAIFRRRAQVLKEEELRAKWKTSGSHSSSKPHPVKGKVVKKDFWSSFDCSTSNKNFAATGSAGGEKVQELIITAASDSKISRVDNIKLGEEGWKKRYYTEKFEVHSEPAMEEARQHAVSKYIEGLCWVMRYYYQGVCSWQWFYPYHYAPFASDFHGLHGMEINFTLGQPFKPFDQLMGVLPAASSHALPPLYRNLMTDTTSPILDFYPADFELDLNGKIFDWQAVCKLPFIEESRLLAEIAKVEQFLTDEERRRNSLSLDELFVHVSHTLAKKILTFYTRKKDHPKLLKGKVKKKIDPISSDGMNGYMYISDKPVLPLEITSPLEDMKATNKNEVVSVFYKYPDIHPHISRLPEGAVIPRKSISKEDVEQVSVLWHERTAAVGNVGSGRAVPNSISGSFLGELAHRLVNEYYTEMSQRNVTPEELSGPSIDASCQMDLKQTLCENTRKDDVQSSMTVAELEERRDAIDDQSMKDGNNDHMNTESSRLDKLEKMVFEILKKTPGENMRKDDMRSSMTVTELEERRDAIDDQSMKDVNNDHMNTVSSRLNKLEKIVFEYLKETPGENLRKDDVQSSMTVTKPEERSNAIGDQSSKGVDNGHVNTESSFQNKPAAILPEKMMENDKRCANATDTEKKTEREDVGDDHCIKGVEDGNANIHGPCQTNLEKAGDKMMGDNHKSDVNDTKVKKKRKLKDVSSEQTTKDDVNADVCCQTNAIQLVDMLEAEKSGGNVTGSKKKKIRKPVINGIAVLSCQNKLEENIAEKIMNNDERCCANGINSEKKTERVDVGDDRCIKVVDDGSVNIHGSCQLDLEKDGDKTKGDNHKSVVNDTKVKKKRKLKDVSGEQTTKDVCVIADVSYQTNSMQMVDMIEAEKSGVNVTESEKKKIRKPVINGIAVLSCQNKLEENVAEKIMNNDEMCCANGINSEKKTERVDVGDDRCIKVVDDGSVNIHGSCQLDLEKDGDKTKGDNHKSVVNDTKVKKKRKLKDVSGEQTTKDVCVIADVSYQTNSMQMVDMIEAEKSGVNVTESEKKKIRKPVINGIAVLSCQNKLEENVAEKIMNNDEMCCANGINSEKKTERVDVGDDRCIKVVDDGSVNIHGSCQLDLEKVGDKTKGDNHKSDVNDTKVKKKRKLKDVSDEQTTKDVCVIADVSYQTNSMQTVDMIEAEKSGVNVTESKKKKIRKPVVNGIAVLSCQNKLEENIAEKIMNNDEMCCANGTILRSTTS